MNLIRGDAFPGNSEGVAADPYSCFAACIDGMSGEDPVGPRHETTSLTGVPFAVKDNIDVIGLPTTANTPGLADVFPARDSEAVARLRAAGAVPVAKTVMHELALGITTSAALFPAVRNPSMPTRSAGGSSGGSAAAVASGAVPFALGTDTGGSISIPAAWCGIYGFRPSTGRWPTNDVVPLSPTRDTVGVFAGSLDGLRQVDDAVVRGVQNATQRSDSIIRLGLPHDDDPYVSGMTAEVRAVWLAAVNSLASQTGIQIVKTRTQQLHELERSCGQVIEMFEISHALDRYLRELPVERDFLSVRAAVARDDVRELLDQSYGTRNQVDDYQQALLKRDALQHAYCDVLDQNAIDAFIYPTTPITAPVLDVGDLAVGSDACADVFDLGTSNVNPGSVSGQPVVTIPTGRTVDGSHTGLSIEGRRHEDARLLNIAGFVELALNRH